VDVTQKKGRKASGTSMVFQFPNIVVYCLFGCHLVLQRCRMEILFENGFFPPPLGQSIQNITAVGLFGSAAFFTFLKMPINPIKAESLIINDALCTRFYLWHKGEPVDVFQTPFVVFVEFLHCDRKSNIHRKH
jgi:hypothetical protein